MPPWTDLWKSTGKPRCCAGWAPTTQHSLRASDRCQDKSLYRRTALGSASARSNFVVCQNSIAEVNVAERPSRWYESKYYILFCERDGLHDLFAPALELLKICISLFSCKRFRSRMGVWLWP